MSGACAGAFLDTSNCQTILSSNTVVTGLTGTWTNGVFETGFRVTFMSATVPAFDVTVRAVGPASAALGRVVDFTAPPNDRFQTSTDAVVAQFGTARLYPRDGAIRFGALSETAQSEFSGTVTVELEEVAVMGQDLVPVPGGQCLRTTFGFSGRVAGVFMGMLGTVDPPSGQEAAGGATAGSGMTQCGNGYCGGSETAASCAEDCGCGAAQFTVRCAAGHSCPDATACRSRGRCSGCSSGTAVPCSGAGLCAGSSACSGGGDTNWSCVRFACGAAAMRVPCGGAMCPVGTTCSAGRCACPTNTIATTCSDTVCPASGCAGPFYCSDCERGPENTLARCVDLCDNDGDGATGCNDTDCCSVLSCDSTTRCGAPRCGDGQCNGTDTCANCQQDCGTCCTSCTGTCSSGSCLARRCDGRRGCYASGGNCGQIGGVSCPPVGAYGSCSVDSECGAGGRCLGFPGSSGRHCYVRCTSSTECRASPSATFDSRTQSCNAVGPSSVCLLRCTGATDVCPTGTTCQRFSDNTYGYCG